MNLGVPKSKKSDTAGILKKILIWELSVKFWTMSGKPVNRNFQFLYDGRGQQGQSFEYGAIFEKNLNRGLIRGLNRD